MHYTSVENIHKVIDPLFMEELEAEFEKICATTNARSKTHKLHAFQEKLRSLKFLDPACGSGNFLTETYLSLRRLENKVISILNRGEKVLGFDEFIKVKINQFYGIEVNDFAVTVAKTALWIAESQMMAETEGIVGMSLDFLPLATNAFIVEGNALRMDWGQLGARNENLGDRNEREELRGLDNMAKINGVDSRNLSLGKTPAKGRNICSAKSNETSSCVDSIEYCRRIRAKESERVSPVFVDIEGISHGTRNSIEDLRKDRIFDSNTSFNCEEPLDRDKQDDISFTNSSFLKTISYDYIMGNPPFVGASMMSKEQKDEAVAIFGKIKLSNSIDYVGAWYHKAAFLIQNTNTKCAFVSTNSITQGEQVAPLWGKLLNEYKSSIDFAYRTFRWDSESTSKAHVHCVIIGFSCHRSSELLHNCKEKKIFNPDGTVVLAKNINPYLIDAPNVLIESRSKPICDVPIACKGSMPIDDGNFIFTEEQKCQLIKQSPNLEKYIHRYIGAKDFINGGEPRYVIWLDGVAPSEYRNNKEVMRRIQAVHDFRMKSTAKPTQKAAERPSVFYFISYKYQPTLVIPEVSSERRKYIPIGFLPAEIIPSNLLVTVSGATLYEFGVMTSSVHNAWMRAFAGRLKSDYRYSGNTVYNTFPWATATTDQKDKVSETAQKILEVRESYPSETLASLYDPLTMPLDLQKTHKENDKAVLQLYGLSPTATEMEIIGKLMEMYVEMTEGK